MRISPTASLLRAWFVATICLAGGTSAADPMAPINPAGYKGPVRVACIANSITEVRDKVHPNIDGHREVDKAAFVVLTGMSAEPRDLVPAEPGTSPNYWCTWSAQSYMQGQGAKDNDPILYQVASIDKYAALQLNEENLFGANGWLRNFYPKARGDLWVVLDDGWDIPVNRDLGCRNFSKLDPEKFPSFKGSIPENLVTLNKKVMECGWRGVGLWYRAYEPAIDAERKKTFKSEAEYKDYKRNMI